MKTHLHSPIPTAALIYLLFAQTLSAQAPTVNCPTVLPVEINDYSNNNNNYWNAAWWWDPLIASHDLGETAASGLQITATDHCSASGNLTFRYILSLDLDQNNVYETFIYSDSLPAKNTVYVGNSPGSFFSGTARSFDSRPVNADQKWGFDMAITADSTNRKAQVIWKNTLGETTDAEIPYGNHHIQWFVTDSCGVMSVCEYDFIVRDSKKPIILCQGGMIHLLGNSLQLWASDFTQYASDNFTPGGQLTLGIRLAGTGTGFPYNPDGTPQDGLLFNCNDVGIMYTIELWCMDNSGNVDYCEAEIIIQDPYSVCNPVILTTTGQITKENLEGIKDVTLELVSFPFSPTATTDSAGNYTISYNSLATAPDAKIYPLLNQDPLNGVTVWDLELINRHILGQALLNSPYKLLSADANKSGSISAVDILEIRKLILGIYTEFPNNNSWLFLNKAQTFNGGSVPFPGQINNYVSLNDPDPKGFIGCKIGDVDLTSVTHFQSDMPEDRNNEPAYITLQNKKVLPGQTFTVHFKSPPNIKALQMTIVANGLHLDAITPGSGISYDHFGIFPGNVFTAGFEKENTTFDVQFTALTAGELKDMLVLNSDITLAICYNNLGTTHAIGLKFVEVFHPDNQPVLYAPTPNPWKESTQIGFYLPKDSDVLFTLVDPNGAVVKTVSGYYAAGEQQVRFSKSDFPRAGMYYVRMSAGDFVEVKKMVLVK